MDSYLELMGSSGKTNGALSGDFAVLDQTVLKPLFTAHTHTQNVPRRYQMDFSRESNLTFS